MISIKTFRHGLKCSHITWEWYFTSKKKLDFWKTIFVWTYTLISASFTGIHILILPYTHHTNTLTSPLTFVIKLYTIRTLKTSLNAKNSLWYWISSSFFTVTVLLDLEHPATTLGQHCCQGSHIIWAAGQLKHTVHIGIFAKPQTPTQMALQIHVN